MAGAAGATFLGALGYEAGRARAGGDPALPSASAAAAAQQQPAEPFFNDEGDDEHQASGDELGAPTTRQS